jgi:hypothetical protein
MMLFPDMVTSRWGRAPAPFQHPNFLDVQLKPATWCCIGLIMPPRGRTGVIDIEIV